MPSPRQSVDPRIAAVLGGPLEQYAPALEWEPLEQPKRKRRRRKGKGAGKPKTGRGPAKGKRRIPAESRGKRPANFRWRKRR